MPAREPELFSLDPEECWREMRKRAAAYEKRLLETCPNLLWNTPRTPVIQPPTVEAPQTPVIQPPTVEAPETPVIQPPTVEVPKTEQHPKRLRREVRKTPKPVRVKNPDNEPGKNKSQLVYVRALRLRWCKGFSAC